MRQAATSGAAARFFRALALAVAGTLAACTADGPGAASLEDSIQPQAGFVALAPATRPVAERPPLAALPGEAGAVLGVKTRTYADGLRQDIALDGGAPGNGLIVLVRTTRQPTLDEAVPLFKPEEKAVRAELAAQFPRVPMQVVDRPSANGYGPYGLALGRAPGNVRCAFMWQWIDANRLPRGGDLVGPASVRVRLCRADMTFDAMAAAMDHLVIAPDGASAPVVQAAAVQTTVADAAANAAPAKRPRRSARHHARPARPEREALVPAAGDGPRYMGQEPVTAPAGASAGAASPPPPSDLPPQAYLGPKAARAN